MDKLTFPEQQAFRVGFLLIDGFALMSYSAAVEVLRAANLLAGRTLHYPAHSWHWGAGSQLEWGDY